MASQRIRGITIKIGADTNELQKALQGVDKQLSATRSALYDINKLLKLNPGNVDLLRQKQQALTTSIQSTKERLDKLREAQSKATNPQDYDKLQREIIETENKLESLENEYKNFGSVQAQQVKAAGEKLEKFGDKVTSVGTSLTQKVTLPLVALGTAGAKSFAEVDKTMQLANKTMGNTEAEAQALDRAMKDAATNSTFGMKDAATATLNFARAGLDAKQAAASLAPAMNLAAGEGGNLDTVSAGLVATINGFHGSFDEAGHYADVFSAACNNSALDVDSLSRAMSIAAPIFSSAGYKVNDAALYMGVMANNGIQANKAATSLKTGMARLAQPSSDAAAAMGELGISLTDANGQMKDSKALHKNLYNSFKNLTEAEKLAAAGAIFGKNQMAPWLALINTAPEDVDKLDKSLSTCAGTTQEMADTMMSGFGGSLEALKSSLDVFVTSIGQALAPTIMSVAKTIKNVTDAFNKLTPAQQQNIVKIGMIVAAAGPLLVMVGKGLVLIGQIMKYAPQISAFFGLIGGGMSGLVSAIGGGLSAITGAVGSAVSAIGTALMGLGPTGWIIIGVIAAVAAISVAVYKNWDKIKAWTKDLVANAKKKWAEFKKTVSDTWKKIQTTVKTGINTAKTLISTGWNAVKTATVKAWTSVRTAVTNALNTVRSGITSGMNRIKNAMGTAWSGIRSVTTTVWSNIRSTVSGAIEKVRSVTSSGLSKIRSTASTAFNSVKSVASSAWSSIYSTISSKVSSIRYGVTNAFSTIRSSVSNTFRNVYSAITSPLSRALSAVRTVVSRIKSAFKFTISLPKIRLPHIDVRWLSVGNFFRIPKLSVRWYKKAYENAVMFNQPTVMQTPYGAKGFGDGNGSEVVLGMNKLRELVGGSGDMNTTINIYAQPNQNVNQLADEVSRRMTKLLRQKGAAFA